MQKPAAKMEKTGKEKKFRAAAQTMGPGQEYQDTMGGGATQGMGRTLMHQKVKDEADQFQFTPPELVQLERKLQVLPGEWFVESMFHSEDVAAVYLFQRPTHGPFLVVPSLTHEDL